MCAFHEGEDFGKALSAAWRLLYYRPRSSAELTQRLEGKGYSPEVTTQVLKHLQEAGEVDDDSFAKLWVMQREANKPMGKYRLVQELKGKGIPTSIISRVLAGYDWEKEYELAALAAGRRWEKLSDCKKADEKELHRLANWLQRRGFGGSVVRAVVTELGQEVSVHDS